MKTEHEQRYETITADKVQILFYHIIMIALLQDDKSINGAYVKTKDDSIIYQLWVKEEKSDEVLGKLQSFVQSLGMNKDKGLVKFPIEKKKMTYSTPKKDTRDKQYSSSKSMKREGK